MLCGSSMFSLGHTKWFRWHLAYPQKERTLKYWDILPAEVLRVLQCGSEYPTSKDGPVRIACDSESKQSTPCQAVFSQHIPHDSFFCEDCRHPKVPGLQLRACWNFFPLRRNLIFGGCGCIGNPSVCLPLRISLTGR